MESNLAAAGSPYPPREERELTSGGDSGLTSWIRDPLIGQSLTVGPV